MDPPTPPPLAPEPPVADEDKTPERGEEPAVPWLPAPAARPVADSRNNAAPLDMGKVDAMVGAEEVEIVEVEEAVRAAGALPPIPHASAAASTPCALGAAEELAVEGDPAAAAVEEGPGPAPAGRGGVRVGEAAAAAPPGSTMPARGLIGRGGAEAVVVLAAPAPAPAPAPELVAVPAGMPKDFANPENRGGGVEEEEEEAPLDIDEAAGLDDKTARAAAAPAAAEVATTFGAGRVP